MDTSVEECKGSVRENEFTLVKRKRNTAFEKCMNVNGIFKEYLRLTDEDKMSGLIREKRFKGKWKGDFIITARLKPECSTSNKKMNEMKIVTQINKDIKPDKILDNGFCSVDLVFKNIIKPNKCLDVKN